MKILQVSAVVVVLDQITKALTRSYLDLYDSVPVITNFFHLTYVTNDGMAFGLNFPGGSYVFLFNISWSICGSGFKRSSTSKPCIYIAH